MKSGVSMRSRTTQLMRRSMRLAPVLYLMFAGCTCSEKPAEKPVPAAPAAAQAPARPANTPVPTQAVSPSVTPTAAGAGASQDDARKAVCESYVAVLSGRTKDPAMLNNAEFQQLSKDSASLLACGAVLSNSDDLCKRLMPNERGPSRVCPHMRGIFSELRTYPKGRGFMLADVDWEEIEPIRLLAPASFNALRDTLRSGDLSKCAQTGDLQSICQAYMTLDPSQCRVLGKLADAEVQFPAPKKGDPAKVKIKAPFEENCRRTIESRKFLAGGLEELAKSGPPTERELAKAALGQADACASYVSAAVQSCMKVGAPQGAGVPASQTPAPQAPDAGKAPPG